MDTRLLKVFQAVARHGGLAGAAVELHLTPSALSHRLKGLETELGCRLFERSGRRMTLTQAGEQLLAAIEAPLQSLAAAAANLRSLGRWGHGRLRIGIAADLCAELLPRVMGELRREFATLHMVIETGELPELAQRIRDRKLDLAVGVAVDPTPGIEFQPIFEDELAWMVYPDHPWAEGRALSLPEMRKEPMVQHPSGSPTAILIDRYFQAIRVDTRSVVEVPCLRVMKELVQRNQGVAILAPWVVAHELSTGKLVMRRLGGKGLRRSWVAAHAAGRRMTLVEERFRKLLERDALRLWRVYDSRQDPDPFESASRPVSGGG